MSGVAHVIGMKPIFKLVFQAALCLEPWLASWPQATHWRWPPWRFLAHRAQKIAALFILWKQGLHQSSLDEFLAVSLKLGCLGTCTQCGGRSICRNFGMVVGRRMITPAAAFQHQGTIGVVRVKELRHGGNLFQSRQEALCNNAPTFS